MQILYFEDETEKKLKAENLKVKAENEELRGELAEKELENYHLQKELTELKIKNTRMDKDALEVRWIKKEIYSSGKHMYTSKNK